MMTVKKKYGVHNIKNLQKKSLFKILQIVILNGLSVQLINNLKIYRQINKRFLKLKLESVQNRRKNM